MAANNNNQDLNLECFNKICRTCLSTDLKLKPLNKNNDLVHMLSICIPHLKISSESDKYPEQICILCISRLNAVFNFIEICSNADEILKKAKLNNNEALMNHLKSLPAPMADADTELRDQTDSSDDEDHFEVEEHKVGSPSLATLVFYSEPEIVQTTDDQQIEPMEIAPVAPQAMDVENAVGGAPTSEDHSNGCYVVIEKNDVLEKLINNTYLEGFTVNEIKTTTDHLTSYKECVTKLLETEGGDTKIFDAKMIEFKCVLCENKLNIKVTEETEADVKNLEFTNLNDDAHVLCKKRIKVLRTIIQDLFAKKNETQTLNNSWQQAFLTNLKRITKPTDSTLTETTSTGPEEEENEVEEKEENVDIQPNEVGYRKDAQVYLGHLTWVIEVDFDKILNESRDTSRYLNSMAILLFGADVLATSSICGTTRKGVRKPALNPIKMMVLKNAVKFYMKHKNIDAEQQEFYWKNFNKILGRKICNLSVIYRKKTAQLPLR